MRFPVVISREDLGYVASEVSSGVASQGPTVEDALANLKEALELYYEDEKPDMVDPSSYFLTTMEVAL